MSRSNLFTNSRKHSKVELDLAILWLNGECTNEIASKKLGVATAAVYQRMASILRTAVREDRIAITRRTK